MSHLQAGVLIVEVDIIAVAQLWRALPVRR